MKVIYSLYTKPIIEGRWEEGNRLTETIKMFTLSMLYALEHYDKVEVYTDKIGQQFFRHLPVEVKILKRKDLGTYWIKSKLEAIADQKEPFIHVDGDVFFLNKLPIQGDSDVIVERIESDQFNKHYKKQVNMFHEILEGSFKDWNPNLNYSLNCGVIGFQNLELRDRFIENYKFLKNKLATKRGKEIVEELQKEWYEICIFLEQYNLTCTTLPKKYKIQKLLTGTTLNEQKKEGQRLRYSHLYGKSKYEKFYVDAVDEKLKSLYLEYYSKIVGELETFNRKK